MPHEVWSKVMFLHLSVILFTRGSTHPPCADPPRYYRIRLTSGQYASYWNVYLLQECIPVRCVPPAVVVISGGVSTRPPWTRHHPTLPWTRHPPTRHHHTPQDQAPPQTRHPPVNRITHACENITLPQLRCGR